MSDDNFMISLGALEKIRQQVKESDDHALAKFVQRYKMDMSEVSIYLRNLKVLKKLENYQREDPPLCCLTCICDKNKIH